MSYETNSSEFLYINSKVAIYKLVFLTLYSKDLTSNSLNCISYNSYCVSMENLVLDQLIIP